MKVKVDRYLIATCVVARNELHLSLGVDDYAPPNYHPPNMADDGSGLYE